MGELQGRVMTYASRSEAEMVLFVSAFAETLFVPVTADPLLTHMTLVNPAKAFRYALLAMLGSVCGSLLVYFGGLMVFLAVGDVLIRQGFAAELVFVRSMFADYSVLLVLAAGVANISYRAIAPLCGFSVAPLLPFLLAGAVARSGHYGVISWLLWRGGVRQKQWIDEYFQGMSLVIALGLLLFFVMALLLIRTA